MTPSALARGVSNPMGKLTAEIPKIKVTEETKEELERAARVAGMPLSEFIRWYLEIRAHGFDMVCKLHADRLRVVAGSGEVSGGNQP